ncbi:putative xylogalacturonan beta-1,3-xylosyltransferase [Rosa chinensis]|uniref:Putative xylogalacturonan beta-1,3-xylosyltransferase n=1 Tax=Rosa chinensis TaxID=74649 RepID=A0A2P6RJS0_ROSCH|nr:probable glycosyltransferase At3g07620 [Rosa chinensis]XP_040370677.1 probable glycosyltransferase At3g07620 [Rosa chinensis]PRQ46663.1 putative xylogalacturonan beta-1,3-xylosyltransferase [Rosa chinensis]
MDCSFQFLKLLHIETRRRLLVLGVVAVTYLLFQWLLLPYENALRSLLPQSQVLDHVTGSSLAIHSSAKSVMVRNPLTVNSSDLIDAPRFGGVERYADNSSLGGEIVHESEPNEEEGFKEIDSVLEEKGIDNAFEHAVDGNVDKNSSSGNGVDIVASLAMVSISNEENGSNLVKADEASDDFPEPTVLSKDEVSTENTLEENTTEAAKNSEGVKTIFPSSQLILPATASFINRTNVSHLVFNASSSVGSASLESDVVTIKNGSLTMTSPGKKMMKCNMPPKSITSIHEMNLTLVRHHAKPRALRPRWSSVRDQDILAVKSQIQHPPMVKNDRELYAPLFRNVSMFKRSYELMERTLKVYIYKEGNKPIFHQPILKGLYASEGWFMKLMEGHKRFVVKDPRKAHLFYMPFSSRMLEFTLYVRNSHNRTNLRQYLKAYSETIAAKYPYWNRTGGADHFLVACHDWAPYETRHHMERCIKALCNADVTQGFKIGRDVSLPETYVRSARNPLRDLGGKPASERQVLAFYAGNMHGYLRPILLKYWKDKVPDMEIFGPMPPGVASKMNYIEHMKSSKYCICPKGYEVNSPRVVEAIFYECIPVIISDNFVPPFFEVLNWGAFSLILAEKDIPNLKDILLSIPDERYLQMQLAVKKAQKHFLWHPKPLKYDLFHMTLHSIWYNRVFQIKPK